MTIIPVYKMLLVPHTTIYLKNDLYTAMSGRTPLVGEKVTLIVTKDELAREELENDSFYPIGLAGVVMEVHQEGFLVVQTGSRVNLEEISVSPDHRIDIVITKRPDTDEADASLLSKHLSDVKSAMRELSEKMSWGDSAKIWIEQWKNLGDVAAAMSPWVDCRNEEAYAILAEDSAVKRAELLEKFIYENLEMMKLNQEASSERKEDYQKIYRENAIKKQLEYLQRELDELHPENVSDLRKLEIKIEEAGMNEQAYKEAKKILGRLRQEGQNSAETGMLYNYLDFITGLSWKKEEPREIDLNEAERILEEDHFGLKKVKDRILQQIAVMNLKKKQSGSILLFVGAPGTGKTSIGQSIARALERAYVRVSLGGVRDEADIRGHRRTYIGAMPGRIMDAISKAGTSNPVMVLDEVDKLSVSYNGDPASALLEVLDPEQNSNFTDHYMNVPYDLSDVMFICTANTIDTIPEPLLNRMEVIQFQGYTPIEKFEIARRHLLPKAMEAVGLSEGQLTVTDDALRTVISDYTREAGVRGLKKRMDTLCRAAAVQIVRGKKAEVPAVEMEKNMDGDGRFTAEKEHHAQNENHLMVETDQGANDESQLTAETDQGAKYGLSVTKNAEGLTVTKDNLQELLDMNPLRQREVRKDNVPGIVTGLAWTSVGGEILYIETMLTEGTGQVLITGQLGDVMKESAQLALSLVKHKYPSLAKRFEHSDLHIHVPDGATPKDGPSAGITLTTAIASLVTGFSVDPATAMTGEVSLRGTVNPIGGLPEKLMAAQRAGVTRVLIPADNEEDLRDVAKEVRDALTIVPVHTVDEVFGLLGIPGEEPTLKAV